MPGAHFNRDRWPATGPHRELLEVLHAVHAANGLRSLRVVGRDMNLAYTQVHKIVRGSALPVDERQVRDLVHAVAGRRDDEITTSANAAVKHWRTAVAASALAVAVAAQPAASGTLPRPGTPGPADDDPRTGESADRTRVPPRRLLMGAAAVIIAAAIAVGTTWRAPVAPNDGDARVAGEEIVLADDFETTELDPLIWNRPERPDVVTSRGGTLRFSVTSDQTAAGLHTALAPRDTGTFREVSFVAAVPSYDQAGPGGIALIVTETGGRDHRIAVGPSNGGPEIAALFCDQQFCEQYDDYLPPAQFVPFEVGEPVPIRLVATGTHLNLYVRDRLVAQSPPVAGPLTSLVFDVYGADSEAWDITVDTLAVTS